MVPRWQPGQARRRGSARVCHRAETALACEPASVRRARHWVLDQLSANYGRPDRGAEDAQLVVSELVTNAVQAHCHEIVLAIEVHHGWVSLAATDDAAGHPIPRTPAPEADRGRGLMIVQALCRRWGVDTHNGRKTIWAEITVPHNAEPTFDCAEYDT